MLSKIQHLEVESGRLPSSDPAHTTTMTDKLPPNLLTLFTARPALRYLPPSDHAPEDRTTSKISGVAQFVEQMKEYEKIPYEPTESWLQRKERIKADKRARLEDLRRNIGEKCMASDIVFTHSHCTRYVSM